MANNQKRVIIALGWYDYRLHRGIEKFAQDHGWHLSAKKWFTGPKTTIDLPAGVSSADEIALEHQHKGHHQPPES